MHRRDFLNGVLLAAGGAAVRDLSPMRAFAAGVPSPSSPDDDQRFRRGGNLREAFSVGHWMRDGRISFPSPNKVKIEKGPPDGTSGTFDVSEAGAYDLVIVGAGLSGLSTAFHFLRERPKARVLILDANGSPGGNAGSDGAHPLPGPAATGGAYAVRPYSDLLEHLYSEIGLDWRQALVEAPFYSYFFDDKTPHVKPGTRGWVADAYGRNARALPYPELIQRDLAKARDELAAWYDREGSPTDPPDDSDVKYDALAQKSLRQYFEQDLRLHPAVSDFYTRFSVDALGGTCDQVSAHAGVSFLGAEYHPLFAFPGGTHAIAEKFVAWLKRAGDQVRLRAGAVALRADEAKGGASVVYREGGRFLRARGTSVVLAGQMHTAKHLVEHLMSEAARDAASSFVHVPVIVANVLLKSAAPLVSLGLGYNQYWWGSRYWADFVIADWCTERRADPKRPVTLTVYGGNERPPEQMREERHKLMTTPFGDYEDSLRDDLSRVLGGGGFDFARDVRAIFLYRWGHGMLMPIPGSAFGPPKSGPNGLVRTPAPRHIARARLGRISFAGQDVEGAPSVECALASGKRAATEALA